MVRSFVLLALLFFAPLALAETTWQFVRTGQDWGTGKAQWKSSIGTANVTIQGPRITITAFDVLGPKEPSLIIEGNLDKRGNISGTATTTHTDAGPWKVKGHLLTTQSEQVWGGQKKVITTRRITFEYSIEFYGFYSEDVRDR